MTIYPRASFLCLHLSDMIQERITLFPDSWAMLDSLMPIRVIPFGSPYTTTTNLMKWEGSSLRVLLTAKRYNPPVPLFSWTLTHVVVMPDAAKTPCTLRGARLGATSK